MEPLSPDLELRRHQLIAHVLAEFKDVSRAGGVSWTQAPVLDDYGTAEELASAALHDRDTNWIELARGSAWSLTTNGSQWSFLDAIGTRYYLAAAMLLDLERDTSAEHESLLTNGPSDYRLDLLSHDQYCVVAMYLRWKRDVALATEDVCMEVTMTDALQAGWDAYASLECRE